MPREKETEIEKIACCECKRTIGIPRWAGTFRCPMCQQFLLIRTGEDGKRMTEPGNRPSSSPTLPDDFRVRSVLKELEAEEQSARAANNRTRRRGLIAISAIVLLFLLGLFAFFRHLAPLFGEEGTSAIGVFHVLSWIVAVIAFLDLLALLFFLGSRDAEFDPALHAPKDTTRELARQEKWRAEQEELERVRREITLRNRDERDGG